MQHSIKGIMDAYLRLKTSCELALDKNQFNCIKCCVMGSVKSYIAWLAN